YLQATISFHDSPISLHAHSHSVVLFCPCGEPWMRVSTQTNTYITLPPSTATSCRTAESPPDHRLLSLQPLTCYFCSYFFFLLPSSFQKTSPPNTDHRADRPTADLRKIATTTDRAIPPPPLT